MATIAQLKELSAKALKAHHDYEARIKAIREKRKLTCPHEKAEIVQQSSMEDGRMSSPIRWEEFVCCSCKKVLAVRSEQTKMSEWSAKDGVTNPYSSASCAESAPATEDKPMTSDEAFDVAFDHLTAGGSDMSSYVGKVRVLKRVIVNTKQAD